MESVSGGGGVLKGEAGYGGVLQCVVNVQKCPRGWMRCMGSLEKSAGLRD